MKSDIKGISTCQSGQESYETYYSEISRKNLVQYDYRHSSGKIFSCIAISLGKCREKRDTWIEKGGK